MKKYEYDIAISFADEDIAIAQCIYLALKLTKKENSIFYYKKTLDTAGKLLLNELPEIYKQKSQFVLMLVSANYVSENKTYVPIEAEAILQRWKFDPKASFLIPVLIDDTQLSSVDESLTKDIARVKWNMEPEDLAEKIWAMIRKNKAEESIEKINLAKKESEGVHFNNTGVRVGRNFHQTGIHNGDNIHYINDENSDNKG